MAERRVLLFDFGGTLDADGLPWSSRFFDAYRAAGGALAPAAFAERFGESDRQLERLPEITRLGFRETLLAQAELVCELVPDGERLSVVTLAARVHEHALGIVRRNRPMLERLARSHALGVVSNFTGNLQICLEELGLSALFAAIADSAVIALRKPEAGAFRHALDALGARPADSWFIGDNPEADIRPALALGMAACWLAPPERPTPPGLSAARRIASLLELEELLR